MHACVSPATGADEPVKIRSKKLANCDHTSDRNLPCYLDTMALTLWCENAGSHFMTGYVTFVNGCAVSK